MRKTISDKLEAGRLRSGLLASDSSYGTTGGFTILGPCGRELLIMSSGEDDGTGWEHVSVSAPRRPPNWEEMCFVKNLFWEPHEAVMQLHPPEESYVNNHAHCLHLWHHAAIPLPPSMMVGIKALGELPL